MSISCFPGCHLNGLACMLAYVLASDLPIESFLWILAMLYFVLDLRKDDG
jgi:uncharacterized membrane protein YccC